MPNQTPCAGVILSNATGSSRFSFFILSHPPFELIILVPFGERLQSEVGKTDGNMPPK